MEGSAGAGIVRLYVYTNGGSYSSVLQMVCENPALWRLPAAAGQKPSADQYLIRNCKAYNEHESLVEEVLRPYMPNVSVDSMLSSPPPPHLLGMSDKQLPIARILGSNVTVSKSLHGTTSFLIGVQYLPMLHDLTNHFSFPDTVLLLWSRDEPPTLIETSGNAWAGYCSIRGERPSLTIPYRYSPVLFDTKAVSRAGSLDQRLGKAVFLGSPTGWARGHRHALMHAHQRNPNLVYAGLADGEGRCPQCEDVDPQLLPSYMRPFQSLAEQVDAYKYIVHADGNCAAVRLKHLLSSDCAVLMLSSNQQEWFYPLLIPFRHYIPVETNISPGDRYERTNLADMVTWAEANPKIVASIVESARAFAAHHLSEQGQTCYMARLISAYSKLLVFSPEALERLSKLN